jgi:hypothetical protein
MKFIVCNYFKEVMNKKTHKFALLLCIFNTGLSCAEDIIVPFNEKFVLSLSGKYNIGIFKQQQTVSYTTKKPWDIGLGLRYKNIAAQIFIPLSFNGNTFDLELNSYLEKLYFELFLKRYQNFYYDKETEHHGAGLDIMAAGITAGWIHNNQNHSLSSVYSLSKNQTTSSGSFLYGFGIFYTSIYSENADIRHYDQRTQLIHFGPMGGYSYTWILPHALFINAGITIGANSGINVTENKILFVPQIKPKISFGHHNRTWSINAVTGTNTALIVWDKNDFDIFAPSTMAVTFSKRF